MATKRWHVCEEFLGPIISALSPLADNERVTEREFQAAMSLLSPLSYTCGIYWLEINESSDYAAMVNGRITAIVEEISDLWTRADVLRYDTLLLDGHWNAGSVKQRQEGERLAKDCQHARRKIKKLLIFLEYLSGSLRLRVRFGKKPLPRHFVPTELQRGILQITNGRALTADNLQLGLSISRSTLYGGKDKRGGLKELVEVGLLKNDRKVGGYFRPDAPPRQESN
jgi:hypothetical protein